MSKDKKILFMRNADIDIISKNVDSLIDKARLKEIQLIEPSLKEFNEVKTIILDFIKKEKRIIYGGYAWNTLIKKVNPSDVFYKETDYTDVEFYSNNPIGDMKKLCDILYNKGYKYIRGSSAQHEETYNVAVNFQMYCDISYMPSNIFYSVMTETIDGLRLIHPKYILVDILRQFNDPITSFWRLDKNIKRGKLMINNYPLSVNFKTHEIKKLSDSSIKLINYLLPIITNQKTVLFIGNVAYHTYIDPESDIKKQTSIYDSSALEIISVNHLSDVKMFYNMLIKYFIDSKKMDYFEEKILMEQFYPYFQFTDKKVVFKNNGEKFLTVYGNNDYCIPFHNIKLIDLNKEEYDIKIGTFNVTFMYNLIKFHQAITNKDKESQSLQDYLMFEMLNARNNFLDKKNKHILDETIFEDFKIECFGTAISPKRKFLKSRRIKKLLPKSSIYPYEPDETKEYNTDMYHFDNSSGNIINNPKDLVFNPKKND